MTMTVTRRIQADKVAISLLCLFDARIPWRSRLMAVAWPGRWAYVLFWWVVLKGSWDLGTIWGYYFLPTIVVSHTSLRTSATQLVGSNRAAQRAPSAGAAVGRQGLAKP